MGIKKLIKVLYFYSLLVIIIQHKGEGEGLVKIGIIGANGYSGVELIRLLQHHPYAEITKIFSNSTSGKNILELYPHLTDIIDMTLEQVDIEEIASEIDLMFFATPAGVSKDLIPAFLEKGITCIDVSGDFRLKKPEEYERWYKKPPAKVEYLQEAVYGLPELNRNKIKEAKLIANPGCFPTATLLGLIPALQHKVIDPHSIHVDAKTGVSGAGRNASIANLFTEVNENVKAYKVGQHQHIPEIEQTIQEISGENAAISFVTHLIPMNRGIMSTIYCELTQKISTEEIHQIYKEVYKDAPFIRIRPVGQYPTTKEVFGSNFCDIGLLVDERTNKLIIISVIDNLVKGASGQAIQNMNIIQGWEETAGLVNVPLYP